VVTRALLIAAALLAGACGSFEDPLIVIDLRILSITATPPEQVIPFDPQDPPEGAEDFDELGLVDTEICGLIADPEASRGLSWRMSICAPNSDLRCDEDDVDRPTYDIASGHIDDPEESATAQPACGTLLAEPALLLVIEDAISFDDFAGFGGVDILVELEVIPDGLGPADAIYGGKRVRYAPQLPPERRANVNPTVDRIEVDIDPEDGEAFALPMGRCAEQARPIRIVVGEELPLMPIASDDAAEDYVVPTLDGDVRMFTESLTYQWLASAGSWRRGTTGGTRDASGMVPPLDNAYRPPAPDELDAEMDVSIWMIQRDERLGATWYESCVTVVPRR
jgi:hypothetical protein